MSLLTLAPELNMPNDSFQQLSIDIAVLKTQMTEVQASMDRVESLLTENGLTGRVMKAESKIEELMTVKTWLFWVLGAVGIGMIVNFVRLSVK